MAKPKIPTVKVMCGANSQDMEVVGKTVQQIRDIARDVLNLPDKANALVSGNTIENSYVGMEGDVIEFVKPGGKKT